MQATTKDVGDRIAAHCSIPMIQMIKKKKSYEYAIKHALLDLINVQMLNTAHDR